jgi:glycosyltransferase involved in cell wall biosynthesis
MSRRLREGLFPGINQSQLTDLIRKNADYYQKGMDHDLGSRLESVNWKEDQIVLFVGRLISSKGIHSIIAALPDILEKNPALKLIVVGHGPLREPLEALIWALEKGSPELAYKLIKWGGNQEGSGNQPLKTIHSYFKNLEENGQLEHYFEVAKKHVSPKKVIFTGYLNHQELCYLFPASDVAIFPSIVIEAGPLVFLEAMASGCFPLGTYFGGMAASIDSVAGSIPQNILECMKLTPDQDELVQDIIIKTIKALKVNNKYKKILRKIAVQKYDWQNISMRLATDLLNLNNS